MPITCHLPADTMTMTQPEHCCSADQGGWQGHRQEELCAQGQVQEPHLPMHTSQHMQYFRMTQPPECAGTCSTSTHRLQP